MKTIKILFAVVACLLISGLSAQAQIDSFKVIVDKLYRPELIKAEKVVSTPQLPTSASMAKPPINYPLYDKRIPTSFTRTTIDPVRVSKPKLPSAESFYLRLGYGNYKTPLANFAWSSPSGSDLGIGVNFNHLSSTGSISTDTFSFDDAFWSETNGGINAKYNLLQAVVYGGIDAGFRGRRLYSYQSNDTAFNDSELKQNLNYQSINAGIRSSNTGFEQLNYDFNINFRNASKNKRFSRFDPRENNFKAALNLAKGFNDNLLNVFVAFNSINYNGVDSVSLNRTMLYLDPSFNLNMGNINFDIGVNTVLQNITTSDSSNYFIYPDVSASMSILDESLRAFAGVRGGLEQNTLYSIYDENPFVRLEDMDIRNTSMPWEGFGGIKGFLFGRLNYKLSIGYGQRNNQLFYDRDSLDGRRLLPTYADVSRLQIQPELGFVWSRYLQANLRYTFNNYSNSDTTFVPLHRPQSNLHLSLTSSPVEKLSLSLNAFSINSITARNELGSFIELDPILDISVGAAYDVTDKLAIFFNANNLASSSYKRFYNYPVFSVNYLGGLTFHF